MKLILVESKYKEVIDSVLKTKLSPNELIEKRTEYLEDLASGLQLYQLVCGEELCGFLTIYVNEDEDINNKIIKTLYVERIETISDAQGHINQFGEKLGMGLKDIAKSMKIRAIEVELDLEKSWYISEMLKVGYHCTDIKLEKILPNPENIADVLELINQSAPEDKIIQVMFIRDEDVHVEFIELYEEVLELEESGWNPMLVSMSFEVIDGKYEDTFERSNRLVKWDEKKVVLTYR